MMWLSGSNALREFAAGRGKLAFRTSLLLAALAADFALAQSIAPIDQGRLKEGSVSPRGSSTNTATVSSASITVSKSAFVDGQNVCGAIRITRSEERRVGKECRL